MAISRETSDGLMAAGIVGLLVAGVVGFERLSGGTATSSGVRPGTGVPSGATPSHSTTTTSNPGTPQTTTTGNGGSNTTYTGSNGSSTQVVATPGSESGTSAAPGPGSTIASGFSPKILTPISVIGQYYPIYSGGFSVFDTVLTVLATIGNSGNSSGTVRVSGTITANGIVVANIGPAPYSLTPLQDQGNITPGGHVTIQPAQRVQVPLAAYQVGMSNLWAMPNSYLNVPLVVNLSISAGGMTITSAKKAFSLSIFSLLGGSLTGL